MSWTFVRECTSKAMQKVVDQAKKAFQFCSDGYAGYEQVNSSPSHSTSQTYSVEANNTKLRHYVSQLMRRMRAFATSARGKQLLSSCTVGTHSRCFGSAILVLPKQIKTVLEYGRDGSPVSWLPVRVI